MTEQDRSLLESRLKQAITEYLDDYVVRPAVGLVTIDFLALDDVASLLVLHRLLQEMAEIDASMPVDQYLLSVLQKHPIQDVTLGELLSHLAERGDQIAELRTVFFSYVFNLANSACISILSASYLGAIIVTRSLLELLVGVGSGMTGKMSERIKNLRMLAVDEKKTVSECWRELSGWAHPHKKWLKNLCPVLVAKGPLHHPEITRDCLVYLGICTDLAFAIAFDKFAINPDFVRTHCIDQHVEYRRFQFLRRRIEPMEGD